MTCRECYVSDSRITPLINKTECLLHHTQYICGNCGRAICIEEKNGLRRIDFPFKSKEEALCYLRVSDYLAKAPTGIYEMKDKKRHFYKIFKNKESLEKYLRKHPDRKYLGNCYMNNEYVDYPSTKIKKLSIEETDKYLSEIKDNGCNLF